MSMPHDCVCGTCHREMSPMFFSPPVPSTREKLVTWQRELTALISDLLANNDPETAQKVLNAIIVIGQVQRNLEEAGLLDDPWLSAKTKNTGAES